jgi:hypothetical protein
VVARRLKEAHFPKIKTLEEIDFETAGHLPAERLRKLAEGDYLIRTEPVIFLGDAVTGDALGNRAGGFGLPAAEASAVHHRAASW